MFGRTLKVQSVSSDISEVMVDDLQNGTYTVSIVKNGIKISERFVINH
ncbi:MAG: hypothetical protein ACKOXF_08310 [Chitinophagaceae bacterium]